MMASSLLPAMSMALIIALVTTELPTCSAFVTTVKPTTQHRQSSRLAANHQHVESLDRRAFWVLSSSLAATATTMVAPAPVRAAERIPLEASLYTILRVREATQQEARLIKTGKFKDVQRANVKLAVKFMIENYRLGDAFVAASAYLEGNDQRMAATAAGQNAVQDLYTILEYFDSSDVQNLKIAALSLEKESVVLKGLDATRQSIDDFLGYFPKEGVDTARAQVKAENDLNFREFDRSLGEIVNANPTV